MKVTSKSIFQILPLTFFALKSVGLAILPTSVLTAADFTLVGNQGVGEDWNTASSWNPAGTPSAGNHYFVDYLLRTTTTNGSTFGGDSLTVRSGGSLIYVNPAVGTSNTPASVMVPSLILDGGSLGSGMNVTSLDLQWMNVTNLEIKSDSIVNLSTPNSNDRIGIVNATISGSGSITMNGVNRDDILFLKNVNAASHTGNWNINGGRLILESNSNNSIGDNAGVVLSGSAIVDMRSNEKIGSLESASSASRVEGTSGGTRHLTVGGNNASTTYAGVLADNGAALAIRKEGSGTLVLTNGGSNFSGGLTIAQGAVQANSAGVFGASSIQVDSGANVIFNTDGYNFTREISGAGNLQKIGSGAIRLSGANANTYTGETLVSGGILRVGKAQALGNNSAVTVSSGAAIELNGFSQSLGSLSGAGEVNNSGNNEPGLDETAILTVGGNNQNTVFSGSLSNGSRKLSLTKVGTGTLELTGVSNYTGQTIIEAGTLKVWNIDNGNATANTSLGVGSSNIIMRGGTFEYASSNIHGYTRGVTLEGDATLRNNSGMRFDGKMTGAGNLHLDGTGYFAFVNAANDYTGVTTIGANTTYQARNATSLGAGGGLATQGTVVYGTLNVGQGAVADFNLNEHLTVKSGGRVINSSWSNTLSGSVVIEGTNTFSVTGGMLSISGAVTGQKLVKTGAGELRLSNGGNNFNGVNIQAGRVVALASNSLGSIAGGVQIASGAELAFNTTGYNYGGDITGDGGIAFWGGSEVRLSGAGNNTYTGSTQVSGLARVGKAQALGNHSAVTVNAGGQIQLNNWNQSLGSLSGTGTVSNSRSGNGPGGNNVAQLTVGGNNQSTTFGGVLADNVSGYPQSSPENPSTLALIKTGTGTLALSGVNTYSGPTTVQTGNLQVGVAQSGSIVNSEVTVSAPATLSGTGTLGQTTRVSGTLSPGDTGGTEVGTLNATNVLFGTNSVLNLQLAGSTQNIGNYANELPAGFSDPSSVGNHDHLVASQITLDPQMLIQVSLLNGFTPQGGDVFDLIDGQIVANGFNLSNLILPDMPDWMIWDTSSFFETGSIALVVPEPGKAGLILGGSLLMLMSRRRKKVA